MPLSPACTVGGKEKALEKKPLDWVEYFRPIRHGGLRVFLWTMVFLLEGAIGLECLKFENFPWGEAPVVIILVGLALLHFGVQFLMGVAFLFCFLTEDVENFKWMWKYFNNNVYSHRLNFYGNNKGLIRLSTKDTCTTLREEKQNHTMGEDDRNVQFSLRLGGWFFRRRKASLIGGCRNTYPLIDVSPLLKKDRPHVKVSFLGDSSVMAFSSLENAVDYLLIDYGSPEDTIRKLDIDSGKLPALVSASRLATSLEYILSEMLLVIQNSIKENPRLAEHRAANQLLVELLGRLHYGFREAEEKLGDNPPANLNELSLREIMPWQNRALNQINQLEEALATATARNAKSKPNSDPAPPPQSPKDNSHAE